MTRKQLFIGMLAAAVVATSSAAWGHHSFSAMYDAKKPIRLVGKLTKIQWTNPHSFFYLAVTDSKGVTNTWAVEGAGSGALSRRGFNKGDIELGDTLIVQGYLARSGARLIDGRLVTLPNGRVINGSSPDDGGPRVAVPPPPSGE